MNKAKQLPLLGVASPQDRFAVCVAGGGGVVADTLVRARLTFPSALHVLSLGSGQHRHRVASVRLAEVPRRQIPRKHVPETELQRMSEDNQRVRLAPSGKSSAEQTLMTNVSSTLMSALPVSNWVSACDPDHNSHVNSETRD